MQVNQPIYDTHRLAIMPLTFLSLRAAITAGRRSICCASRRFFTDAWCWRALFSLKFRIVFSWLLRSHVKLWNTPTVTCNSHEPVFCNLDASTDTPTLSVLTLSPQGSMYLPTHFLYNFWSWQCYLQLHETAMPFIIQLCQHWNAFRLHQFLFNLGSSAFLLSDAQHSFLPFALVTTGLELILTTIQVASVYVATTMFLVFL